MNRNVKPEATGPLVLYINFKILRPLLTNYLPLDKDYDDGKNCCQENEASKDSQCNDSSRIYSSSLGS